MIDSEQNVYFYCGTMKSLFYFGDLDLISRYISTLNCQILTKHGLCILSI